MVIEQDLYQIAIDLDRIREGYAPQGYGQDVIEKLEQIFALPGNRVTDDGLLCHQEDHLQVLKWLIPALVLLPQSIFTLLHRFRNPRTTIELPAH